MRIEELAVNTLVRQAMFDRSDLFPSVRHKRVLDIGAGTGFLTGTLQDVGAMVTAIDVYPGNVSAIRQTFPGVNAEVCDAHDLSRFRDQTFEVVVCSAVIEHFAEPERVMREIHRVLAPGGLFYLTIDIRPKITWRLRYAATLFRKKRYRGDPAEEHLHSRFTDEKIPDFFLFWDEQRALKHLSERGFHQESLVYGGGPISNLADVALWIIEILTRRGDEQNLADHQYRLNSPIVRFYAAFILPLLRFLARWENVRWDAFTCLIKFRRRN